MERGREDDAGMDMSRQPETKVAFCEMQCEIQTVTTSLCLITGYISEEKCRSSL